MIVVLTVQEYNEQVKAFYPQDWAKFNRASGYVATNPLFSEAAWGRSKDSAIKKFERGKIPF